LDSISKELKTNQDVPEVQPRTEEEARGVPAGTRIDRFGEGGTVDTKNVIYIDDSEDEPNSAVAQTNTERLSAPERPPHVFGFLCLTFNFLQEERRQI